MWISVFMHACARWFAEALGSAKEKRGNENPSKLGVLTLLRVNVSQSLLSPHLTQVSNTFGCDPKKRGGRLKGLLPLSDGPKSVYDEDCDYNDCCYYAIEYCCETINRLVDVFLYSFWCCWFCRFWWRWANA